MDLCTPQHFHLQNKKPRIKAKEEVELRVQTAYNKLERTEQMVKVSEQLLALRVESSRVSGQQLARGVALKSHAGSAAAQELDAKTALLQAQLDYLLARDEMTNATGRTPQQHHIVRTTRNSALPSSRSRLLRQEDPTHNDYPEEEDHRRDEP
jgi:outer membrane protein TolC